MTATVQADVDSGTRDVPSTLRSLTGLRFIAAFAVFLFHTGLSMNPMNLTGPAVSPFADDTVAHWYELIFSNAGFVGVSIFFVLSGFVISWSARPGHSAGGFIRRRLMKVFPNHVVMWAVVLLLFASQRADWAVWLPNLFLVHAWIPDLTIALGVNMPAWSLGSELLFYLLFPLLIGPISRLRGNRLWVWAGVMVAGLVLYKIAAMTVVPDGGDGVAVEPDLRYWFGYIFPVGRLFEFGLGALLARVVLSGMRLPLRPLSAALLSVVAYVATLFVPAQFALNLVTVVPVALLVAALAAADVQGTRTGLANPLFVWFGKVSFGFYLVQVVTIFYLRDVTGAPQFSTPVAVLVLIGLFATSLLGGWLLHRFVEMPMMRRWAGRRAPSADPTPDRERVGAA
ncbi:acyltransferase family protein [Actinomycetospora aeridis]|uniref:Acyltransferase n=1 Tax=Actinomycetospora aeridis TaxID=3129231 RepID=A0ABU8N0B1_9PSEU